MGHNQIVALFREREVPDVGVDKVDPVPSAEPRASNGNHARARIDAIDLRTGIEPDEFSEKTAVSFADNQNPAGRF